jgi:iron complex outermembrane receptor protein
MTRSRKRKLARLRARAALIGVPLASGLAGGALAQEQPAQSGGLQEIVVTAQKRAENLQDVPLQVTAIQTEKLEELRIQSFADYIKYLPNVGSQSFGPGFNQVYMRGVASGDNVNHSASLPSVGIYLDEQPITTITGALDVHVYDIARVEALAGPQGTLYGASSQSGTLRIITNKPDPSAFSAAYDLQGNAVDGAGGYLAEAYANIPLSDRMAVRLVGWTKKDAGFIDNVAATRVFPTSGAVADTGPVAEDDYNDVDTYGGRAALRFDLSDSWTITPSVMAQEQETNGFFAFDPNHGDLATAHVFPDTSRDRWYQAALTVEGAISNFDVVYAGSYLQRDIDAESDYSDYSFFYDALFGYGSYWVDNANNPIDPTQYILGEDAHTKISHELRFSTPGDNRTRFVGGLFMQRQVHDIEQRYLINDLNDGLEVTLWSDTIWLTQQQRVDRDYAAFGEVSFDVSDKLTLTGGLRFFEAENSLEGFFGFGTGYSGSTGEAVCFDPAQFHGAPCRNLDKTTKESDSIHRLNIAYDLADDKMVYATWSRGFRPGGINRRGTLPPYDSDFLTNYELGWKSTWSDNRLRFNGAVFHQEWDDFQFAILGAQGLTEIKNAAQAEIRGVEGEIAWAVSDQFTLTGGASWLDTELTENYCGFVNADGAPETNCPPDPLVPGSGPLAPAGVELPITPKFKANVVGRYEFPLGAFKAHVQGSAVHEGARWTDMRTIERELIGRMPEYTIADFSFGLGNDRFEVELFVNNAFDERAELWRFAQCAEQVCATQELLPAIPGRVYVVTNQPRTFGIKFGQRF